MSWFDLFMPQCQMWGSVKLDIHYWPFAPFSQLFILTMSSGSIVKLHPFPGGKQSCLRGFLLFNVPVFGILCPYLLAKFPLVLAGSTKSKLTLMVPLTQEYDINYEETFALVVKMTYARALIAATVARGWPLYQLDVKIPLFMEIFTRTFIWSHIGTFSPPQHICRLRWVIYGLK